MIDKYATRALVNNTDRMEFVVFMSKTGQGTFHNYNLYCAKVSFENKNVTDGGGRLIRKQTIIFRFYAADLDAAAAPQPKENDRFQRESGNIYVCTDGVDVEMIDQVFVVRTQLLPV